MQQSLCLRGCEGKVCEFACTSEDKSPVDALDSKSCFAISVLTKIIQAHFTAIIIPSFKMEAYAKILDNIKGSLNSWFKFQLVIGL